MSAGKLKRQSSSKKRGQAAETMPKWKATLLLAVMSALFLFVAGLILWTQAPAVLRCDRGPEGRVDVTVELCGGGAGARALPASARLSTARWPRCTGRKTAVCRSLEMSGFEGTQRLFGFDPDKLDEEQAVKFAELKASDLKSARAWAIKEVFRGFWYYSYEGRARKFFKSWSGWASRSRLKPLLKSEDVEAAL